MRIGNDDNSLLLEATPLEGGYTALRVEAVSSASHWKFTAAHDRLMMNSDEATVQRFADFADLKRDQFETAFTEGGWLRFHRDSHGAIVACYRIGGSSFRFRAWKASMEGEVFVDGEFANSFCREFGALLRSLK
jgi:hypothetical protein